MAVDSRGVRAARSPTVDDMSGVCQKHKPGDYSTGSCTPVHMIHNTYCSTPVQVWDTGYWILDTGQWTVDSGQ